MTLYNRLLPWCLLLRSACLLGQTTAPADQSTNAVQSFAVATFKLNKIGGPAIIRPTTDGIIATDVTFHMLIANAYENGQIEGGPAWTDLDRYDVSAKVDEAEALSKLAPVARVRQLDVLLQALLAERCNLRVHTETKEVPAYALTPSRSGKHIKPGTPDPDFPRGTIRMTRGQIVAQNIPMTRLAEVLSGQLGRPVLDRTGLPGGYDFVLQWETSDGGDAPDVSQQLPNTPSVDDPRSAIPAALQRELGLKLEPTKSSAGIVVIDHLERPSGN
jgi:uncharacterized protein (TIGR03435 family)